MSQMHYIAYLLLFATALLASPTPLNTPSHNNQSWQNQATSWLNRPTSNLPPQNLPIPLTTNLTGPAPPRGFTIKYMEGYHYIDEDSFYATTIDILSRLAYQDFSGTMPYGNYFNPPHYQHLKVFTETEPGRPALQRKYVVWGLAEMARYSAAMNIFKDCTVELFWQGRKQGQLVMMRRLAEQNTLADTESAVIAANNSATAAERLRVDELDIQAKVYGAPIEYNAALLALVSGLAYAAQYAPNTVTHGLSVRYAPWPAYFVFSDHGWERQMLPPTQPPFLTWAVVIAAIKVAFEEFQMGDVYGEMEILVWSGETELAQGGVFLFPEPVDPELGQA